MFYIITIIIINIVIIIIIIGSNCIVRKNWRGVAFGYVYKYIYIHISTHIDIYIYFSFLCIILFKIQASIDDFVFVE